MLGVFAEELLEGGQQVGEAQSAVRIDVPGRVVVDGHLLGGPGQIARDHLAVDRVGDADGSVLGHQAEVADVLDVIGGDRLGASQQRLDHSAHPLLLQLVGELV